MAARRAEIACAACRRMLAGFVALGFFASSNAASKLGMTATPLFVNGQCRDGISIELDNSGQDAKGAVTITTSSGTTVYPIELPRGARKRFVAYPLMNSDNPWDQIACDLDTDRGSIHIEPSNNYDGNQEAATLEIGDELGGLQFLEDTGAKPAYPGARTTSKACYVKPDDAPGRLVAYRRLAAIVLGSGAERMSDAAVQALKQYVLGGGRLVFVGGSGAPVFRDPRWADTLPLSGIHAETRTVSLVANGQHFSSPLSVQAGAPISGSTLLTGGIVTHPNGLGLIIVVPFDFLDGPAKKWSGRSKFLTSLTAIETGVQAWGEYGQDTPPGQSRFMSSPGRYGRYYPGPGAPTYMPPNSENDPFSFEPPRPESVGWIVLCYLLVVAPLNFLVLRKLRRSEWAWFTTPCISIIFAVFLLKLASSLYLGKLMTSTHGTLVVAEHGPVGIFRGSSQMFFPSGGSYDLKLSGIDWLASADPVAYGSRAGASNSITAFDVDQLIVPGLSVRNLQFKEIQYEQLVDATGWFTIASHKSGGRTVLDVSNRSPYTLSAGSIFAEGSSATLEDLKPGASVSVMIFPGGVVTLNQGNSAARPPYVAPGSLDVNGPIQAYSQASHRPILSAILSGFRPGPQVGAEVANKSQIALVLVGDTSTGGKS